MFKILNRYFLKLLILRMILVSFVLIAIVWLTKSIQIVQKISEGLAPSLVLKLTILSLPPFLVEVIPFALFVTVIMSWSRLILDRELVVMQAAGISPWRMSLPIIAIGIFASIISLIISIFLVPISYQQFDQLEGKISQYGHLLLNEGAVTEISRNQSIYIKSRDKNTLEDIAIYMDDNNSQNQQTIIAQKGIISYDKDDTTWIMLIDGVRDLWEAQSNNFSRLTFKSYNFEFSPAKKNTAQKVQKPNEADFLTLLNPARDSSIDKKDYDDYRSEAHKRISGPLLALSYVLIALAWMKSGSLLRRGHGRRILLATLSIIILRAFIFVTVIMGASIAGLFLFSYIVIAISVVIPSYYLIRSSF